MGYKVEGTTEYGGVDRWIGGAAKSGGCFCDKQSEGHSRNYSHMSEERYFMPWADLGFLSYTMSVSFKVLSSAAYATFDSSVNALLWLADMK